MDVPAGGAWRHFCSGYTSSLIVYSCWANECPKTFHPLSLPCIYLGVQFNYLELQLETSFAACLIQSQVLPRLAETEECWGYHPQKPVLSAIKQTVNQHPSRELEGRYPTTPHAGTQTMAKDIERPGGITLTVLMTQSRAGSNLPDLNWVQDQRLTNCKVKACFSWTS